MTNATDQHNEDVERLYEGRCRWIDVPFPEDPAWENKRAYVTQINQYYSLYGALMPKVPALLTYCEAEQTDEPGKSHSNRVYYRSMVLKPKKWVIALDLQGLSPLNGDETKGEFKVETETEETTKFNASIEFSSEVGAAGGYGPVKGNANLKMSAGASWEKSIKVTTRRVQEVEEGFSYQPTYIYAKLLCEVLHAKAGSFLVNNKGSSELISTNPRCTEMEAKHRASTAGYHKTINQLSGLYDACGKLVKTGRWEGESGFWDGWAKASSARIKMVVDPADARLYVTGESVEMKETAGGKEGWEWEEILKSSAGDEYFDKVRGKAEASPEVLNPTRTLYAHARLTDYRGLYGNDAICEDQEITYSASNLVKVWKVAVKAQNKVVRL